MGAGVAIPAVYEDWREELNGIDWRRGPRSTREARAAEIRQDMSGVSDYNPAYDRAPHLGTTSEVPVPSTYLYSPRLLRESLAPFFTRGAVRKDLDKFLEKTELPDGRTVLTPSKEARTSEAGEQISPWEVMSRRATADREYRSVRGPDGSRTFQLVPKSTRSLTTPEERLEQHRFQAESRKAMGLGASLKLSNTYSVTPDRNYLVLYQDPELDRPQSAYAEIPKTVEGIRRAVYSGGELVAPGIDIFEYDTSPAPLTVIPTSSIYPKRPRTVAAGYDEADRKLTVVFRDGTYYNYYAVSPDRWRSFASAPSKGQFIKQFLDGSPRGVSNLGVVAAARPSVKAKAEQLYKMARISQNLQQGVQTKVRGVRATQSSKAGLARRNQAWADSSYAAKGYRRPW
jgi:KTSC domain